jgi:transposase InsO family protein
VARVLVCRGVEVNGKFYYLTFILDAYSRRIVGHKVSQRLFTEQTTLPALEMALNTRKNQLLGGLIFHSDGGGQFYDKAFLKLTKNVGILNSMCEYAWENGKAERINGVIKNNYLKHRKIENYSHLVKEVDRSVSLYNHDKPHIKLKRLSPITFENKILNLSSSLKETNILSSKIIECIVNKSGQPYIGINNSLLVTHH